MEATSSRKTKRNGISATEPMVEAVKNSRTEPNSRIAVNSVEGDRPASCDRIPRMRDIRRSCTVTSICRPTPSMSLARASLRTPSITSAIIAPMASTQSVATD